jgi:chromosome segregation ATPase
LSLEEKAKIGELAKKHAEVTHEKRLLEDEKKVLESELEAERMVAKKNKSDAKKFKSKYKELKAELEKTLDTVELLKKERDILKMRPETRDAEAMTDPVSVQSSTDKENMPPEPPTLRSSLFSPGEKSRPADISAA